MSHSVSKASVRTWLGFAQGAASQLQHLKAPCLLPLTVPLHTSTIERICMMAHAAGQEMLNGVCCSGEGSGFKPRV